jgi:ERF superfamily
VRTSEQLDKIAPALVKAQSEFPEIPDSRKVDVPHKGGGSHSYSYAELISIQKLVQPTLTKYELAVIQLPKIIEGGSALCTRILHSSGQWIEEDTPLSKGIPAPQDYGSLISYIRRYSQVAALNLKTGGDDDGAKAQKSREHEEALARKARLPAKAPVAPRATPPAAANPAAPVAPDRRATDQQLSIIWNQIKADLKKDDAAARSFIVQITGKKTTAALMVSDIDRLKLAIPAEKAKSNMPAMPAWDETTPLGL